MTPIEEKREQLIAEKAKRDQAAAIEAIADRKTRELGFAILVWVVLIGFAAPAAIALWRWALS